MLLKPLQFQVFVHFLLPGVSRCSPLPLTPTFSTFGMGGGSLLAKSGCMIRKAGASGLSRMHDSARQHSAPGMLPCCWQFSCSIFSLTIPWGATGSPRGAPVLAPPTETYLFNLLDGWQVAPGHGGAHDSESGCFWPEQNA